MTLFSSFRKKWHALDFKSSRKFSAIFFFQRLGGSRYILYCININLLIRILCTHQVDHRLMAVLWNLKQFLGIVVILLLFFFGHSGFGIYVVLYTQYVFVCNLKRVAIMQVEDQRPDCFINILAYFVCFTYSTIFPIFIIRYLPFMLTESRLYLCVAHIFQVYDKFAFMHVLVVGPNGPDIGFAF